MAEGRVGVVKKFLDHTTPSARTDEASRLFLDRAATPPPAEEGADCCKEKEGTRLISVSPNLYVTASGRMSRKNR